MATTATVTVDCTLRYQDSNDQVMQASANDLTITPAAASPSPIDLFQTIGITEESINLGDCTAPGMMMITTDDDTNYVKLRTTTGGKYFAKVAVNIPALLYPSTDNQAMWAIAVGDVVKIRIRITPA